ncbi:hypothetical protein ANN_20981 [Periplaneta americana]|uniref:Reverse transcriptase domain-containing protein n=1 Tax=Periplaneta americana TaxID=6978 RepID=A0ABQ8SF92_PERAM|nr:hypothetical protein ANN_20981 [Periplaneta americana]
MLPRTRVMECSLVRVLMGKKFSHEISASVWDRCPPSIVMHLGSYASWDKIRPLLMKLVTFHSSFLSGNYIDRSQKSAEQRNACCIVDQKFSILILVVNDGFMRAEEILYDGCLQKNRNSRGLLLYSRSTYVIHFIIIRQIMEKKWEYKGTVHQLFINFKKAYDSIKREVVYDILLEFGIPKKLLRLIKMCLSETYRSKPVE